MIDETIVANWEPPKNQENCVTYYNITINDNEPINVGSNTQHIIAEKKDLNEDKEYKATVIAISSDDKSSDAISDTYNYKGKLFTHVLYVCPRMNAFYDT